MGKSICALLLSLLLTVALFHHAHCRRSPAKVLVAAAAANKPFKEGTNWSVGDIFVASHNEFGFPRIDVLDPEDLSVKDTYDLAQACGVHAKTRGISFSPRFSSMKLQLAVSCISDDKAGSNGNVVLVAAKHPSHPVLATLSVPQAAASTFDRSGTLYVVGVQGDQAAGTGSIQSNHFSKEPVAHLTPAKSQSHSGSIAAPPAGAAISFVEGSQQLSHRTPVVLYSFDAALHSRAMQGQQQVSRSSNTTEPFAVTTAAVMPEDAVDASDIALDLDARAAELYYTHGGSHLGTYSIIREKHLAGRPLPSTGCTAVLALFDGSVLVACSKCLYHAPADASQPVYKETCLDIEAPFGKHVAVDPEGTTLLISTTDGSLHVFSMSDFEHKLQHILLPGRTVGGIAVLGTVPANQVSNCSDAGRAGRPHGFR